jgi:hypothetical protein
MYPNYRVVRTRTDRRTKKNYRYMNSSTCLACGPTKPQGIGFGGANGEFRVWLDRSLTGSYCRKEDACYEPGSILTCHTKALNINLIEAWSVVEPPELDDFDAYKQDYDDPLRKYKPPMEADKKYYWEQDPQTDFYWMKEEYESDEEIDLPKPEQTTAPTTAQLARRLVKPPPTKPKPRNQQPIPPRI